MDNTLNFKCTLHILIQSSFLFFFFKQLNEPIMLNNFNIDAKNYFDKVLKSENIEIIQTKWVETFDT